MRLQCRVRNSFLWRKKPPPGLIRSEVFHRELCSQTGFYDDNNIFITSCQHFFLKLFRVQRVFFKEKRTIQHHPASSITPLMSLSLLSHLRPPIIDDFSPSSPLFSSLLHRWCFASALSFFYHHGALNVKLSEAVDDLRAEILSDSHRARTSGSVVFPNTRFLVRVLYDTNVYNF